MLIKKNPPQNLLRGNRFFTSLLYTTFHIIVKEQSLGSYLNVQQTSELHYRSRFKKRQNQPAYNRIFQ